MRPARGVFGNQRRWDMKNLFSVIALLALVVSSSPVKKEKDESWLVYQPEIVGEVQLEGGSSAVVINLIVASPYVRCEVPLETLCLQKRSVLQVAVLEQFSFEAMVPNNFEPKNGTTTQGFLIKEDVSAAVRRYALTNPDIHLLSLESAH